MVSDFTIHSLTLEVLLEPAGIAADENSEGYPDRLKVCIGVEPRLADAGVVAQILNLAARLAAEVTAWVRRSSRTRSGRPLRRGFLFKRLTLEMLLNKIAQSSQKLLYLAMPVAIESAEADKRLPKMWR